MQKKDNNLFVYNSYSRKLEQFSPLHPPHVGMYVCGPTMSGESHLGHARPFITFDVIYRYLRHLGYSVRYVRNITDVGHFEEEQGDKIAKKALLQSIEPMELVHKSLNLFHNAMHMLNCLPPSIEPSATGHIMEQIEMIQELIELGYAYEVNGSVYFSVRTYGAKYPYGKLSGRVVDELLESTRALEKQDEKQDTADFSLWKKAPPSHIMRWNSPWGVGFPGWHIECSAMSRKYLGEQFDIHGGGMDLMFPHHESEIAQSTICHGGQMPAKYWLHNNMITVDGKKMGKSYNNHITLSEMFSGKHSLLQKPYHPLNIRFFILQTHYRSTLDFSNEALQAANRGLHRLLNAYETLLDFDTNQMDRRSEDHNDLEQTILSQIVSLDNHMSADFNTAKVLATLFEIVPTINAIKQQKIPLSSFSPETMGQLQSSFKLYMEDILGLASDGATSSAGPDKSLVKIILGIRDAFKAEKQYEKSDQIRHQLLELGVDIKDEKDGTTSFSIPSN